jgi:hypothetical protein
MLMLAERSTITASFLEPAAGGFSFSTRDGLARHSSNSSTMAARKRVSAARAAGGNCLKVRP